ncbi:hypothetical protein Tco_1370637 [Tanacetum coccineum]
MGLFPVLIHAAVLFCARSLMSAQSEVVGVCEERSTGFHLNVWDKASYSILGEGGERRPLRLILVSDWSCLAVIC